MKIRTKKEKLHIAIIVIGIIFISLSAFHSNIWFDEAYSVGMAERTMKEIWDIGGHDVHPVLYYWMLRIVSLIATAWGITGTAGKIIVYRIFSVIPVGILGMLGYTHIKKEFGEKTGMIFSFLVYFLSESGLYANEIRMYSWAILTVTILAIYAYRLRLVENSNRKNWLIFFAASITSIFLHYYGLMAAGIINIILLIYLIKNKRGKDIVAICVFGMIQLISYMPWFMCLARQMNHVSKGFWIAFTFPDSIYEIIGGQFLGNLPYKKAIFIVTMLIYIYLAIKIYKQKENKMPVILATGIYLAVIISAIVMTKLLNTPILYYRYLFVITGLIIFAISYILGKEKNNKVVWLICAVICIISTINNVKMIKDGYSTTNLKQYQYLKQNIEQGDIIIYKDINPGSTIAVYFTENQQYFYNPENWNVEEAYKALGKHVKTYIDSSFTQELEGRIWIIDEINKNLYNELFNNEQYKLISEKEFYTAYHEYSMNMILIEKN